MKLLNCGKLCFLGLIALAPSLALAQDGSDINQAIPIFFGQTINDIIDNQLKGWQVYSINLAQGQKLSVVGSGGSNWCIGIYPPTIRTIAGIGNNNCRDFNNGIRLAYDGFQNKGLSFDYTVPAAGKYFIVVQTFTPSTAFSLQATAVGTPLGVANPPTAGCLTGPVDSITYSLQFIAAGIPDEVSIGGTRACASCPVKAPQYPEISNRLEGALKARVNVQACYDSAGNIFQIKLVQP